jgi:valyl-tRNA synthetase
VAPFVTEELWTALKGGAEEDSGDTGAQPGAGPKAVRPSSIVVAEWPVADEARVDASAEAVIDALQRLVTEVRRFRSDQGLKPGQKVAAVLAGIESTPLAPHEDAVRSLLRLTRPEQAAGGFTPTASLAVGEVTVQLDTAGAIDVPAERARLEKDLAAARKEVEQAGRKLGNADFMAKAPEAVITKNRDRLAQAEADITRLQGQLAALPTS